MLPRGGGATWVTGSYDPELNLLYWGTGNPNPDYYGGDRLGDNLYTASLVALDADTGKLKWHYQFTPHDLHDWDSNHVPVLADLTIGGRARKVVMVANRNGFFYTLDRATGELLLGKPYTDTKWAREIGPDGSRSSSTTASIPPGGSRSDDAVRARLARRHRLQPAVVRPRAAAVLRDGARDLRATTRRRSRSCQPARVFMSGGMKKLPEPDWGALRAIDPRTGEMKWEHRLPTSSLAGVMSTASGLVFAGDQRGLLQRLRRRRRARSCGSYRTGSPIWGAAAITYMLDGRQYVLIPSGNTLVAFALPGESRRYVGIRSAQDLAAGGVVASCAARGDRRRPAQEPRHSPPLPRAAA